MESNPALANEPDMPKPAAEVVNPATQQIEKLYRNIEDEPLIKRIKALEQRLMSITGKYSIEEDVEEIAEELGDKKAGPKLEGPDSKNADGDRMKILKELLDDFNQLLMIPYGALGYLVSSDSESIIKLYGVDTDREFYAIVGGSKIRVSQRRLEEAVAASGRRFIGERGLLINNPAETTSSEKLSDEAINEIIAAIQKKLS